MVGDREPHDTPTTAQRPTHPYMYVECCPACGAVDLEPVLEGEKVNLLCPRCHRCWHVEHLRVSRVDPATCAGCSHRFECRSRYDLDAP